MFLFYFKIKKAFLKIETNIVFIYALQEHLVNAGLLYFFIINV